MQVAAALHSRLSVSPIRREDEMKRMMEQLQVREIMFTNATEDAVQFITKKKI